MDGTINCFPFQYSLARCCFYQKNQSWNEVSRIDDERDAWWEHWQVGPRSNMRSLQLTILNFFTNKVKVYLNLFHFWVQYGVGTKVGSANVVTLHNWLLIDRNKKFLQERLNPTQLSSGRSYRLILCFSWWASNWPLLFGDPQDRIMTKEHDVSTCRTSVIFISSSIDTREGMER